MIRNILLLVILAVLIYGGWYAWKTHRDTLKEDRGDYTCEGCLTPDQEARFQKENSGETADGNSERKFAPARIAAEEAVEGYDRDRDPNRDRSSNSSLDAARQGYYGIGDGSSSSQPVIVPSTGQRVDRRADVPAALPMRDTEPPNAPNGERFAGAGDYMWYRQGNLTWRVDTRTGRSCIIYATMEEWRKPIVMRHGCGRNG
jgi:hypothetical protein